MQIKILIRQIRWIGRIRRVRWIGRIRRVRRIRRIRVRIRRISVLKIANYQQILP